MTRCLAVRDPLIGYTVGSPARLFAPARPTLSEIERGRSMLLGRPAPERAFTRLLTRAGDIEQKVTILSQPPPPGTPGTP